MSLETFLDCNKQLQYTFKHNQLFSENLIYLGYISRQKILSEWLAAFKKR